MQSVQLWSVPYYSHVTLIGGQITGLYEQGKTKRGMDSTERSIRDRVSEVAILPFTPFAMAEFLPPEVWTAISIS